MTYQATTIDLLRHGQTQASDILRGRVDVPLSPAGYQQMTDRLAPCLTSQPPWQRLISSPLQRCADFTEALARQHNIDVSIEAGFLEMDFGDWDGRPMAELRAQNPTLFDQVWQQPDRFCPPGGETFQQFSDRIQCAYQALLRQYPGQHLLLVCHGGVIRALLGLVLQTPLTALSRLEVPYACFSRLSIHHHSDKPPWPQLVFHNRV